MTPLVTLPGTARRQCVVAYVNLLSTKLLTAHFLGIDALCCLPEIHPFVLRMLKIRKNTESPAATSQPAAPVDPIPADDDGLSDGSPSAANYPSSSAPVESISVKDGVDGVAPPSSAPLQALIPSALSCLS